MATSTKKMNEAAVKAGIERAKLEKLLRQERRTSEEAATVASSAFKPLSSSFKPLSSSWQNTRLVPADVKTAVPSHFYQDTNANDRLFDPPSTFCIILLLSDDIVDTLL